MAAKRKRTPKAERISEETLNSVAARGKKDERIAEIIRIMYQGTWQPYLARVLAKSWGMSASAVQGYAVEASRIKRMATPDLAQRRELHEDQMDAVVAMGLRGVRAKITRTNKHGEVLGTTVYEKPDLASAASVLNLQAKVYGFCKPIQLEHSGTVTIQGVQVPRSKLDQIAALTDEQAETWRATGELPAEVMDEPKRDPH